MKKISTCIAASIAISSALCLVGSASFSAEPAAESHANTLNTPSAQPSAQPSTASMTVPNGDNTPYGPVAPSNKPLIKLGTAESAFNLGASESMIAWERWHHLVGKAIHNRVKKVTNAYMGRVLLTITVTKDCKLTAQIVESTNSKMGEACLAATQSLDGDTVLIFPQESNRQAIRFKFEYKRGIFFMPKNHYITDDYEHVGDKENDAPPH